MDWLAQNWIWILVALLFVSMHFGHGGHGGGCGGSHGRHRPRRDGNRDADAASKNQPQGHQH